jgi:hypothetical protein
VKLLITKLAELTCALIEWVGRSDRSEGVPSLFELVEAKQTKASMILNLGQQEL